MPSLRHHHRSSSNDAAATPSFLSSHRPFLGRRGNRTHDSATANAISNNANVGNNKKRPIYGRRSKSYDPRLNANVANEHRVPMDVRIGTNNAIAVVHDSSANETKMKRTYWSNDDENLHDEHDDPDLFAVCSHFQQHDQVNDDNNENDYEEDDCKKQLLPTSCFSKRRLSNPKDREDDDGDREEVENENPLAFATAVCHLTKEKDQKSSSAIMEEGRSNKRVKLMRGNESHVSTAPPPAPAPAADDDDGVMSFRSTINNDTKEETLSFTDFSVHDDTIQHEPESSSNPKSHQRQQQQKQQRRSSATTTTTNTITIRPKSSGVNIVIPGSSQIKDLRDFAKSNNGTAIQYKATYHIGSKPIHDKNHLATTTTTTTIIGDDDGPRSNNNTKLMIQNGQLIIKETFATLKGNKGGNSYAFDYWKLPGSRKRRDSSIYDSTRPQLVASSSSGGVRGGQSRSGTASLLTTRAPNLIVDTALSTADAAKVRKFVAEAKVGQTPSEFFGGGGGGGGGNDDEDDENANDEGENNGVQAEEEVEVQQEASPFDNGGSMVSGDEEDGDCKDVSRKILGDKSNTVHRTQSKDKALKPSTDEIKLSNKYHKERTRSARKKRKLLSTAPISSTEPRKRRLVEDSSVVRFYVPESKHFGFIEGIGGGYEEEGRPNITPHRGRLVELPGAVLSGQWESRLVKDMTDDNCNGTFLRISLRHESSSLPFLENFATGKDDSDSPDGHFVSMIKPVLDRVHTLIHQGILLEEELDTDYDGKDRISNNAFIGCISIVLFDGFFSSSEAMGSSRDVASTFLKNCVPSNELQSGRNLYGIVGNEHDSKDSEIITGILYPCNLSFDSNHVVLLLCNEECQIYGIDIVFRPPKEWLTNHPLTEALLGDHMSRAGSGHDEIMKRYTEKNILRVFKRPSPLMRNQVPSLRSRDDLVQDEEQTQPYSRDEEKSGKSIGFAGADQPDLEAIHGDLSSATDHNGDDEKVLCLLLEQQVVDVPLVKCKNAVKPVECVVERSEPVDKLTNKPPQIEPDTRKKATAAKEKSVFAVSDLFGDSDSLFDELADKAALIEPATLNPSSEAKEAVVFTVRDLFGESDSLFGVATKNQITKKQKQIKRRMSTGDLSKPRTSPQKENRGRYSTGALPDRRNCLGKADNSGSNMTHTMTQAPFVSKSKPPSLSTSRQTTIERELRHMSKTAEPTDVTRPPLGPSKPSVRMKAKNSGRRLTFPIESRGKLRFISSGATASTVKKSMGSLRIKEKVSVSDLWEDSGSLFGCAAKKLTPKKTGTSKCIEHDTQSVTFTGGASCSFESLSSQSVGKVQVNATMDTTPVQPLFDVYFGKESRTSNSDVLLNGAVTTFQQVVSQPFFDCCFGQEHIESDFEANDESTMSSMRPFHSVYYGQADDESTLHSITSTFETPTVPSFLFYFGLNEGIEQEHVETAQPPFFGYYFGQDYGDESSLSLSVTLPTILLQSSTTLRPSFFDYYHGQESVLSSTVDAKEPECARKTSWRSGLALCVKFLVIGVLPALMPLSMFIFNQNTTIISPHFNVHGDGNIISKATNWWSLKP